ncbi:type II secretion system F family protein [Cellulomonas citrea]|uniref:type II secretion system F family protein n=1 Tax=Cellulomonas citrea TaxID=1909423 RepID=UPI00135C6C16|nr:type II secretion system F family protein [Cellulomonas citrea]
MSPAVVGGLIGLALGTGVWLVVVRLRARHATLDQRLAPYLRAARRSSALLVTPPTVRPLAAVERLAAPFMADALRLVTRLSSPTEQVRARLVRAGRHDGVEQFRVTQVVGLAAGLAVGLAAALALLAWRGSSLAVLLVLVGACAVTGVLVPDWWLGHQVKRRETTMLAELPAVAELLALAVAAGEGALGALERVAATSGGELGAELARTLAEARAGEPLTGALDHLATRTGLPALARFAEGIAVAVTRGTPLADVMRAQAQDVREAGRRALMEAGGRKEVAMMVPVVFLILPVTVVFAVFPSLVVLQVGP